MDDATTVRERFASLRRRARSEAGWWASLLAGGLVAAAVCHVVLTRCGVQDTYRTLAVEALGPQTRVLALGSSHAYEGIDPRAVGAPEMTLGADGFDYRVMESVLAGHLPRLEGLSVLLIELDIAPLLFDTLAWYDGDDTPYLELEPDIGALDAEPLLRARLCWEQTVAYSRLLRPFLRREKLAPLDLARLLKGKRRRPVPGFFGSPEVMLERNTGEKVVAAHRRHLDVARAERNLPALDRTIAVARRRGVRVVLVRFPKHRSYVEATPPEWTELLDESLAWLRARHADPPLDLWDFEAMDGLADDDFADADHLNRNGARKLTAELAPRIAALLRER